MRSSISLSFTALGALSVGVAATADAATGPNLAIEEVTVTARKFEESLQDAPVSVTAFTASALEAAGLKNISDISNYTPGLYFQKDQGRRFDRPGAGPAPPLYRRSAATRHDASRRTQPRAAGPVRPRSPQEPPHARTHPFTRHP